MIDPVTFLYLTDLHLTTDAVDDEVGDYTKSGIVPSSERTKRQSLLKNTLTQISAKTEESINAIIINGDVTNINGDAGYKILPDLINLLPNKKLSSRTVIVPGNHDISRDTEPSSLKRYGSFHSFVKEQGFISPALEGVDIHEINGIPLDRRTYRPDAHFLLDDDMRWAIIPINCANYYGSIEPLSGITPDDWQKLISEVEKGTFGDPHKVGKFFLNMRRRDAARISDAQMAHVTSLVEQINQKALDNNVNPDRVIKIAVVHHQLLPISEDEEVKPFESLTNLGAFRQFLYNQNFSVVLHGHKHIGQSYWDHVYDGFDGASGKAKRILILSAASIRNTTNKNEDACRLLTLNPREYAPTLQVSSFPLLRPGGILRATKDDEYSLFDETNVHPQHGDVATVIAAQSAAEVYERLTLIFDRIKQGKEYHNIICHVHGPETLSAMIDRYPVIPNAYPRDKVEWFNEIINWWQSHRLSISERGVFNHGTRILQFDDHIDQLDNVKSLLKGGSGTSRATISLLDPRYDGRDNTKKMPYPSLCTVQFALRDTASGRMLDCIGYFRKQEMRVWWPINLAELAFLQKSVYQAIAASHTSSGLALGTITTIAAVAVSSAGVPRVAIPAVDRAVDLKPDELWRMVYALNKPSIGTLEQYKEMWHGYLDDLIPPDLCNEDGVPVAVQGIRYLLETSQRFDSFTKESKNNPVTSLLQELLATNSEFARTTANGTSNNATQELNLWRDKVITIVSILKESVDSTLALVAE